MDELMKKCEQLGEEKERVRIMRAFREYKNREKIPLEIQKDLAKIITIDIEFD